MKAISFPGISQPVSPLALGLALHGSQLSLAESHMAMDAYFEAGGNFFDSAHVYAVWLPDGKGASERALGQWVRSRGVRDKVIIGTKGGHPPLDDMSRTRLDRASLEQDLTESLERLDTDCVDLYWLHRDDVSRPVEDIIQTLAGFVSDGRIRAFGASNWTVERMESANAFAAANGLPGFVASQPKWSLACTLSEAEVQADMRSVTPKERAWHTEIGLPSVVYSSQAGGWFGEDNVAWAHSGFSGDAPRAAGYDTADNRVRLLHAAEMAEAKGCTAGQVALAWLLHQPFPVVPIIGNSNPSRIGAAMAAVTVELSPEEVAHLETLE